MFWNTRTIMKLSIPNKATCFVDTLLPRFIEECKSLLPSGFICQQDGAPAHTVKLAQDWIDTNCSEVIGKSEWPPNLPDVNSLDFTSGSYAWTLQDISSQAMNKWTEESI